MAKVSGNYPPGSFGSPEAGKVHEYKLMAYEIIRQDPSLNPNNFTTDPEGFFAAVYPKLAAKANESGKPIDPTLETAIKIEVEDIRAVAVIGFDA